MPIYIWEHTGTGERVEVLRSFSESDVPPSKEKGECQTEGSSGTPEGSWEKRIGNTSWVNREGWGPKGKGSWGRL